MTEPIRTSPNCNDEGRLSLGRPDAWPAVAEGASFRARVTEGPSAWPTQVSRTSLPPGVTTVNVSHV